MTQYINKSALVAEIERRIKQFVKENNTLLKNSDNAKELRSRIIMCKEVLSFIDTLEVKEVDLKKELRDFVVGDIDDYDMGLAKHFYELGLKAAQNEHKSCTTDE